MSFKYDDVDVIQFLDLYSHTCMQSIIYLALTILLLSSSGFATKQGQVAPSYQLINQVHVACTWYQQKLVNYNPGLVYVT